MTDPAEASDPLDGLRIREAARAVLVSRDHHVLLVRFDFLQNGMVWATPGGGLDPGETHEQALRRELEEELGLVDVTIGPHIWNRVHVIPFFDGRWDGQRERYHLVRVDERFTPQPRLPWEQLRHEYITELRWWPIDEVHLLTTPGTRTAPATLSTLLDDLVRHGPPVDPIDVPV